MSYDATIDISIVLSQIEYKMWSNHQVEKSQIDSLIQNELNTNWELPPIPWDKLKSMSLFKQEF
jgi:hypothetical protein